MNLRNVVLIRKEFQTEPLPDFPHCLSVVTVIIRFPTDFSRINSIGVTEKYKALIDNLGMLSKFIDVESLDLDKYVTDKAIEGLFSLVANEEKLIRDNPAARTTDLLKKVFSNE